MLCWRFMVWSIAVGRIAVIDFETTGMSPQSGARPTELAVLMLDNGVLTERYQSLINPGVSIPWQIQQLTGISNAMVRNAPSLETVMREAVDFVGTAPLLAHNAAFDSKFWAFGCMRAGCALPAQDFLCSVMLSRRIFPHLASYRLSAIADALDLPANGVYHRAMADAEVTAWLAARLQQQLRMQFGVAQADYPLLRLIQGKNKKQLADCVKAYQAKSENIQKK